MIAEAFDEETAIGHVQSPLRERAKGQGEGAVLQYEDFNESHGVPSLSFPSSNSARRLNRAASSWLCVTTTMVAPSACCSSKNRSAIVADVLRSKLPVGSSARMSAGLLMNARAIA